MRRFLPVKQKPTTRKMKKTEVGGGQAMSTGARCAATKVERTRKESPKTTPIATLMLVSIPPLSEVLSTSAAAAATTLTKSRSVHIVITREGTGNENVLVCTMVTAVCMGGIAKVGVRGVEGEEKRKGYIPSCLGIGVLSQEAMSLGEFGSISWSTRSPDPLQDSPPGGPPHSARRQTIDY